MIPNEIVNDILKSADILTVISSYLNVIKKGNNYYALCPFHNDKDPSLQISVSKQIYKCFSCGEGGNVFNFVAKYENISYVQAIVKVASLIGYESPYLTKSVTKVDPELSKSWDILKQAKDFYCYVITTEGGKDGLDYLKSRHIDEEMIKYFSLGFAPENGSILINTLRNKGFSLDDIDKCGLLVRTSNLFLDRFKGRVTFPLFDEYGNVVGFSARRIKDSDEAKFINSSASKVFNKSSVLYNYQNAIKEARKEKYVYVVEGFMDVISFYRAGIKSCVALMGTAFTNEHAKMLKRLNVEVRMSLDGDDAGQHGIVQAMKILEDNHISYKIVNYQNDLRDPDDIFNQDGKDLFLKRFTTLQEKNDFLLSYFVKKHDLTSLDGKKKFIEDLLENKKNFSSKIEREIFLNEVSKLTSLNLTVLEESFKNNVDEKVFFTPKKRNKQYSKVVRSERKLIYYMLQSYEAVEFIKESNVFFIHDIYMTIANYILEFKESNPDIELNQLINSISMIDSREEIVQTLISIAEENNLESPFSKESANEYIKNLEDCLKKQRIESQLEEAKKNSNDLEQAKLIDSMLHNLK